MDSYSVSPSLIQTNRCTKVIAVIDTAFALLLCQYVVFPRTMMWLKAATLAFLMAAIFYQLRGELAFTTSSFLLSIYILFNLFFTISGIVRGYTAVAVRSSTIHLIWPATYLLFSGYQISVDRLYKLFRLLIGLACFVLFISTVVIFTDLLHLSSIMSILNKFRLGGYAGMSGLPFFRTEHIFFYAFFAPFLLSSMMMENKEIEKTGIKPVFVRIITVYALVLTVFSGMGAIWFSVFIGAIICVMRYGFLRRRNTALFFTVVLAFGLIFVVVSYINRGIVFYILEEVASRLNKTELPENELIRHNQIEAMIETWKYSPYLGNGFGCPVRYYRAGVLVEQADNEMTYYVMLYQRGIVGLLIFFSVAVQSVRSLVFRTEARWICEPFAVGTICFLVANSFNPYLSNMSTLWILFLPFIIGNKNEADLAT